MKSGSRQARWRGVPRQPWLAIGAWLGALVAAGFLIVSFLGDALTTEADVTTTPESRAAELLIEERLSNGAGEPTRGARRRSWRTLGRRPGVPRPSTPCSRRQRASARRRPRATTPTATSRSSPPTATRSPCRSPFPTTPIDRRASSRRSRARTVTAASRPLSPGRSRPTSTSTPPPRKTSSAGDVRYRHRPDRAARGLRALWSPRSSRSCSPSSRSSSAWA